MNQWAVLSFVIFLFTVMSSPLVFEAGEQLTGREQLPGIAATPTISPDLEASIADTQRMIEAFAAKSQSLDGRIERIRREMDSQQAVLYDLDQQLTAQQSRSAQAPAQEDLGAQERRIRQAAALAQLQSRISGQQSVVTELAKGVREGVASNINSTALEQNRVRLEEEQRELSDLQAQYQAFQVRVGLDDQRQLEQTLSKVMTEKFDTQRLERQKSEVSAALERLRGELATAQDERARAQAELENLESLQRTMQQQLEQER